VYTIKADVYKNRLYVTLDGFLNHDEMKKCTDQTIEETRKLHPGYDVITDISQFKPVSQDTMKEVERAQAHFKASGIRHGVRVEGKAKLAAIQFSNIGKNVNYKPDTFATIAEAEKHLDSLK
jgi:hypothetical protein